VPLVAASLFLLAASPCATAAERSFTTGFDDPLFGAPNASIRDRWLSRAVQAGAGIVRLSASWAQLAPVHRPPGFNPADPADSAYRWSALDDGVRSATNQGLEVLITLGQAPRWAEGSSRPAAAAAGSWRPNAAQFGAFARAAALRFSGHFPDPEHPGLALPRVRYWQLWNEPNLSTYLEPQWTRTRGRLRPASPLLYRALLNAGYRAVKRVHADNFVISAGTAPYGDPSPGGRRLSPVPFLRGLLCLRGSALRPAPCHDPAHLDAISHHPYAIGGPNWHVPNPEDAAVPDLGRLTRVLRKAERSHRVRPAGHKPLWVTEISWDSDPPDPRGVPARIQAQWLEESLYLLWRQRVQTVTWFQVADAPPVPNFSSTVQGGVYFADGRPKPSERAFRFPFVVRRSTRRTVSVWGRAPLPGLVRIQLLRRGAWTDVLTRRARGSRVFTGRFRLSGERRLRAISGAEASLVWRVRR
jgi:hypothetical protein